jgi:radical SAM protein with 4Fe4S-binding SPASM domain
MPVSLLTPIDSQNSSRFQTVEIEINSHCNRACSYCPNSVAERIEKGEMDPELYSCIIDQLVDIRFDGKIAYEFYNEPLLAKNFDRFLVEARTKLPQTTIELYTNGTLLTLKRFRSLLELGINRFVVTKHEGIKNFAFDKTFAQLTESEKELVLYRGHEDVIMTNRGGCVTAGPSSIPALTPCYIPEMSVTITLLGNVLPCFEDFNQKLAMGNVKEKHLWDIWNTNKYRQFREDLRRGLRHKHSPCNTCNRLVVLPDTIENMVKRHG